MTTVGFNVTEDVVVIVHVHAVVVFEIAIFLVLFEACVELFKHLLVLVIRLGGHGWYLVLGLHEFFMNDVVLLSSRSFEIIAQLLIAVVLDPLQDLTGSGVQAALI